MPVFQFSFWQKHFLFIVFWIAAAIHGRNELVSNRLSGDNLRQGMVWDTRGYFAYLPAIAVYGDLSFGFIDSIEKERYRIGLEGYEFRVTTPEGKVVNKCFVGSSVLLLPGYWITHLVQQAEKRYPADGYAPPYLDVFFSSALVYVLLGIWCLYVTLLNWKFAPLEIVPVLALVFWGTNLFYYTIYESGMTHAFSFFAISLLLFLFSKALQKPLAWSWFLSASLCFGLIVLIRPVNGIVLVYLPFVVLMQKRSEKSLLLWCSAPKRWIAAAIAVLVFPWLQLLVYKIQTGHFLVYSYTHESFDFANPHFIDILFSFRKGLFIYTPAMFLLWLASSSWIRAKKYGIAASWIAATLMVTYVLSSWWSWWYGGSFGLRAFVDFYPFMLIPGVQGIQSIRKNKWALSIVLFFFLLLTEFNRAQIWQYKNGYIHWDSMDREKYIHSILHLPDYFSARYQ